MPQLGLAPDDRAVAYHQRCGESLKSGYLSIDGPMSISTGRRCVVRMNIVPSMVVNVEKRAKGIVFQLFRQEDRPWVDECYFEREIR
jgi:hypothetical protein